MSELMKDFSEAFNNAMIAKQKIEELVGAGLKVEHLNEYLEQSKKTTPFYTKARNMWEETQEEQIQKGFEKYPEPFNPHSWTPKQLVKHALQENVDQVHYLVGLYELLEKYEEDNKILKLENEKLKRMLEISTYAPPGADTDGDKYTFRSPHVLPNEGVKGTDWDDEPKTFGDQFGNEYMFENGRLVCVKKGGAIYG